MANEPKKLFGTDGIRGRANHKLTPELAMRVAMVAAYVFVGNNGVGRHRVIIGKDPRISGYMIENAMVAGFLSAGMDVLLTGPLPTPGVATLTRSMRCDLGVMISASHNAYSDNGIKFFGADGYKLSDDVERKIEELYAQKSFVYRAEDKNLGRAKRIDDGPGRYVEAVKATFLRGTNLEGLKIVADFANGAAYNVAPTVLKELGATVIPIGVEPNGININDNVGSTHPNTAAARVLTEGAHIGIALDGDADRVIILDEKGQVVDGDQILAAIASSWKAEGRLKSGVVATVMSNLGLENYFRAQGIPFERTKVGDRYVNERMRELEYNLGGENSGHVICSDYSTTGDGLIAALQVLAILKKSGRPASEALRTFVSVPQILRTFEDPSKKLLGNKQVHAVISISEEMLGNTGRLLVRYSGTEPIVRVMVEGPEPKVIEDIAKSILGALKDAKDAADKA